MSDARKAAVEYCKKMNYMTDDDGHNTSLEADTAIDAFIQGSDWQRDEDYEDPEDVIKKCKFDENGIYISWENLWKIDAVAVRNGLKAMKRGEVSLFQAYVGQRMLVDTIGYVLRPHKVEDDD